MISLTDVFNGLKFDEVNLETKTAHEYLELHNFEFRCLNYTADETYVVDDVNGIKIHCVNLSEALLPKTSPPSPPWTTVYEKYKNLAIEIEKNMNLFCQLEWLIRKINVDDSKHSLNLIIKNLFNASRDMKAAYIQEEIIVMQNNTPLLVLGFMAQIFKMCDDPIILATTKTAIVCHLLSELCIKSGWKVQLIIVDNIENVMELQADDGDRRMYPNLFNGLLPEVTAIVTDRSDLDSAVDVFINTGSHPIPLTHIFVQESVLEEFTHIMAWKCNLNNLKFESLSGNVDHLKSKCTDVIVFKTFHNAKAFLFNFVGDTSDVTAAKTQVVLVEAYRTVKDLLSLINNHKQLCLSVWASGLPETNEIVLNLDVPIIWVNDYCNFNGPDEISKAIYKRIDSLDISVNCNDSIEKMMKKQENWSKNSFTARCDIVLRVIKSINTGLGDKIELDMSDWKIHNFIAVDNKTMVLGFNVPDKVVIYHTVGTVAVPSPSFDNIIRALINGSGVIIASEPKNEEEIFIAFEKEGVPIAFQESENDSNASEVRVPLGDSWCFHTKVIWTNFGTNFAN